MQHELKRLSEQIISARESGQHLRIVGGNTKSFYGEPLSKEESAQVQDLNISGYTGIVNYEPSELVITARAGTLLSEIEQTLAERNQMLAFEPPRFGPESTIGGVIASGLSGPRRVAVGGVSDFVLGARILDTNGQLLSFGGEVMKNVAGYDVSRLLSGSMGSIGPAVELSIKVLPLPVREQTQRLDVSQSEALNLLTSWRSLPLAISASAWIPSSNNDQGSLYVRVSGSNPAVDDTVKHITGNMVNNDEAKALWDSLRDQTHDFFNSRPIWRVSVPPVTPPLDYSNTLIEWNGGLRWVAENIDAEQVRSMAIGKGGHATLYQYQNKPDGVSIFQPLSSTLEKINRSMIEQFDPSGIYKCGRLLPTVAGE